MDETFDEDNKMSLEEHMLLNTILEIERNASLDYIGSMDQLYLTKLAVATIYEHSVSTSTLYTINSVQKRSILQKINIVSEVGRFSNKSYFNIQASADKRSNKNLNLEYKTLKRKADLVGRPKTSHLDDLNDAITMKTNSYDRTQETTSIERDIYYDDYEFVEMEEGTATVKTITNYLKELLPTTGMS
ncbi:jg3804 [Pararge aegeria aegeria]|uniref:Jg3804 protein n=1 Tax=Pararge aegeria aegeria TaxID=348720 RepID=A0A8S4RXV7_9NEOP|nr:jg3804 [Pararge aegeria aegeria]